MAKILKRDVDQAAAKYGREACQWGEDNLATVRAFCTYVEKRTAWEEQTGRKYGQMKTRR